MEERRRHYRITDHVILKYHQVDEETAKSGMARLQADRMGRDQIRHALLGMETRLLDLIHQISRARPDLAEVLDLMNKKISLTERLVEASLGDSGEEILDQLPSEVNLSGAGLAFNSPDEYPPATLLEVELVLLPRYDYIRAYGSVVKCEPLEGGGFRLAVDFSYIREDDREEIIQHVFRKQHEALRNKQAQES